MDHFFKMLGVQLVCMHSVLKLQIGEPSSYDSPLFYIPCTNYMRCFCYCHIFKVLVIHSSFFHFLLPIILLTP